MNLLIVVLIAWPCCQTATEMVDDQRLLVEDNIFKLSTELSSTIPSDIIDTLPAGCNRKLSLDEETIKINLYCNCVIKRNAACASFLSPFVSDKRGNGRRDKDRPSGEKTFPFKDKLINEFMSNLSRLSGEEVTLEGFPDLPLPQALSESDTLTDLNSVPEIVPKIENRSKSSDLRELKVTADRTLLFIEDDSVTRRLTKRTEVNNVSVTTPLTPPQGIGIEMDANESLLYRKFRSRYPVEKWKSLGLFTEDYLKIVNKHWLQFDPPYPRSHYMLAALYALVMTVGLTGNSLVIFMFIR